jgi:hypothetical protein
MRLAEFNKSECKIWTKENTSVINLLTVWIYAILINIGLNIDR